MRLQILSLLERAHFGELAGIRELPEENWNLAWEQSIKPVEIGERLVIRPSWIEGEGTDDRIVIRIDPKMSFGTGHHETTRLCLRLLERSMKSGSRVLDVGTGTGILAIAAVKLGAQSAIGIDTDEWAIENALENVRSNDVEDLVSIIHAPIEEYHGDRSDALLANLTLNMIASSLSHLRDLLEDRGVLILSGFLESDLSVMRGSLEQSGFAVESALAENGWMALSVRKILSAN